MTSSLMQLALVTRNVGSRVFVMHSPANGSAEALHRNPMRDAVENRFFPRLGKSGTGITSAQGRPRRYKTCPVPGTLQQLSARQYFIDEAQLQGAFRGHFLAGEHEIV